MSDDVCCELKINANDCYFVLGWWVQCHVLCQQWCCACWSWWNTQSCEACCCTRDTRLGSVSCTFRNFGGMGNAWCLQSKVKAHFSCGSVSYSRHIFQIITNVTGSCSDYIIWRFFSSYMQSGDWKWLKNTLDTACCVNHLNFSAHDLSIRVYISLCLCMYTENKFSGFSS